MIIQLEGYKANSVSLVYEYSFDISLLYSTNVNVTFCFIGKPVLSRSLVTNIIRHVSI